MFAGLMQNGVFVMRGSKTFSSSNQPVDNQALFDIARYRKWAKFVIIRTIGDSFNLEKKFICNWYSKSY